MRSIEGDDNVLRTRGLIGGGKRGYDYIDGQLSPRNTPFPLTFDSLPFFTISLGTLQ